MGDKVTRWLSIASAVIGIIALGLRLGMFFWMMDAGDWKPPVQGTGGKEGYGTAWFVFDGCRYWDLHWRNVGFSHLRQTLIISASWAAEGMELNK